MTRVQMILAQAAAGDGAFPLMVLIDRAARAYCLPHFCFFRPLDLCVRRGYLGWRGPGYGVTALGLGVLRDGEPDTEEGGASCESE